MLWANVTAKIRKISVLLDQEDYERFDSYCRTRGYKKSTLASKLIRDLLDREQGPTTREMFDTGKREKTG
jgi:metal-responsive CopG/Arc/MetJ family transcriptional regulator